MYSDSSKLSTLPTVELCAIINPLYSIVQPAGHLSLPGTVSIEVVFCTSHTVHGIGRGCSNLLESLRYCAAYTVEAIVGALCDDLSDGVFVKQSILVPPPKMAISCCRPVLPRLKDPGPAA